MDSFVALERSSGIALLNLIDRTLTSIQRVLRGQDTISTSVQKNGAALLADTIPVSWDSFWEGPESPMDYCRAVVSRCLAIEQWSQKCNSNSILTSGAGSLMQPALAQLHSCAEF